MPVTFCKKYQVGCFFVCFLLRCSSAYFWVNTHSGVGLTNLCLGQTDYSTFKQFCIDSALENEGKVAFLRDHGAVFFCDGGSLIPLAKNHSEVGLPLDEGFENFMKAVGGGGAVSAVVPRYHQLHLLPQPLEAGHLCAAELELCLAYSAFERTIFRCEDAVWKQFVERGDAPPPHTLSGKGTWPGPSLQPTPVSLTVPYLCLAPVYEQTDTETTSYDCTLEVAGAMHCGRNLSADSALYCEWCDGEAWGPLGLGYVYRDPSVCNGTDGWMVPLEDPVFGEFLGSCHCSNNSDSIYDHCEGNIPHCTAYDNTTAQCLSCSGDYVNVNYSICSDCPLPQFPNAAGDCVTCPDGQYARTFLDPPFISSCINCPAGFACANGIIGSCPEGTYSEPGATGCRVCPIDRVSSADRTSCVYCRRGAEAVDGSVCRTCSTGYYKPSWQGMCEECPPGSTTEESDNAELHDHITDCFCSPERIPLPSGCGYGSWSFVTKTQFPGNFTTSTPLEALCQQEIDAYPNALRFSRKLQWLPFLANGSEFPEILRDSVQDLHNANFQRIGSRDLVSGDSRICWTRNRVIPEPTDVFGNDVRMGYYWTGLGECCASSFSGCFSNDESSGGFGSFYLKEDCLYDGTFPCSVKKPILCVTVGDDRW